MTRLPLIALIAGTVALAGCTERELVLPGQRLDTRAVFSPDGPAIEGETGPSTAALSLPRVSNVANWTQVGSNAQHYAGNVAIGAGTQQIWRVNIGQAAGRRHRITADPVIAGGLIYTLDSEARVTATTTSGQPVWMKDLRPAGESGNSVSGGGIAYDGGRIFVTSGYGELVGMDARSGAIVWRQNLGSAVSGSPAASNGTVYVTSRESMAYAVQGSDGKVIWQAGGNKGIAGVMGASAPAVSGSTVVFPFASGQLMAVDMRNGTELWTAQVAGTRMGRAIALMRDMTGVPVIVGNRVFAGTSSGRMSSVDLATGAVQWDARNGALNEPVPAGNSVFVVTDDSKLMRIDSSNGATVWSVSLPEFVDNRVKRQQKIYAHFGPTLAGSKLYVASTDGKLRVFSPQNGALLGEAAIPEGASTNPVVAGQTLYVVTTAGQLVAYR